MRGSIAPKWNELDRIAKLSSMTGIVLGTWGFPLFALVPASILLVASGLNLWFFASTRRRRSSITILVLLGAFVPIFMTVGYVIHLRYPCWPHHPIDYCP